MSSTIQPPAIPDAAPQKVVISPAGIIHVLGYTPTEGERGVPITVRIHFHPELADTMYVRLVVGHKAVATKVRELPGATYGRWQLDAIAPPFDSDHHPTSKVLISVQALNDENTILDSVAFGEFSYWSSDAAPESLRNTFANLPKLQIPSASEQPTMRRRGATTSQLPSSSSTFANGQKLRIHRRLKTQSIVRAKHAPAPPGEKLIAQTPILDLTTPLASICTGWTPQEFAAGHRLVRFSKVQDGRKIIVSCEPIRQEDYCEADAVISCIYREEVDGCFVTSVDVIYLLERLTNGEFPVEEKNRIRRNLEGLRPTTVSKHKPGFGDFFQRIMDFPDPKPRNIEKDLKVFEWNLLGQALEKILSKYSIYTPPNEVTGSTSPVSDPSPLDSPELVPMQPVYAHDEEATGANFAAAAAVQPGSQEYHNMLTGHTDPFASPADSITTGDSPTGFPACPPDLPGGVKDASTWNASTMKMPVDLIQLDNLNSLVGYDGLDPIQTAHGFTDNPTLDFSLYDSLNFAMQQDDGVNLVDQHYVGSV